jgi:hypothetical protein
MRKILSCSDQRTTLKSLEEITGVSASQITQFVKAADKSSFQGAGERVLWESFASEFSLQSPLFYTSFFHSCRRFSPPKASEELLPNHLTIDQIWENIWLSCSDLLTVKSLEDFKFSFKCSKWRDQYFKRVVGDRIRERGPWGFILKEAARRKGKWPEVLNDIRYFVDGTYGVDISERLKERTIPYIIHFRTDDSDPINLGFALLYLYELWDDTPFFSDYKCYSAEGRKIPADCVLSIEKAE